jgi:hypothetical protein
MSDAPQEIVLDERLAASSGEEGSKCAPAIVFAYSSFQEIAAWEAFVGSFTSEESDLAERSREILRAELPRDLD